MDGMNKALYSQVHTDECSIV